MKTISDTASPRLTQRLLAALSQPETHIHASFSPTLPGIPTFTSEKRVLTTKEQPHTSGKHLFRQFTANRSKGKGILLTIDETQAMSSDDLVNIATAVQHVITTLDEQQIADEDKKAFFLFLQGCQAWSAS